MILHIKEIHYNGEFEFQPAHYINYDIPINEIDEESFEIIYTGEGGLYDNCATLHIDSKYQSPTSFLTTQVNVKGGNIVGSCFTDSGVAITLKSEDAENLKAAFIIFVTNYKS